jgi:tRNA(adenine34) deaminase
VLERNSKYTDENRCSHAENTLIQNYSNQILKETKKGSLIELFSTLEPCFMCFGTSILNRISRIVFACPDPYGGVTNLDKNDFHLFYQKRWPQINGGLFKKNSYDLMIKFLESENTPKLNKILKAYKKMNI